MHVLNMLRYLGIWDTQVTFAVQVHVENTFQGEKNTGIVHKPKRSEEFLFRTTENASI